MRFPEMRSTRATIACRAWGALYSRAVWQITGHLVLKLPDPPSMQAPYETEKYFAV